MTGINIQSPWCDWLLTGEKTVETRQYPLPKKYENKSLVAIRTNNGPAKIVGLIKFSFSFKYNNKNHWVEDYSRHLVEESDSNYGWKEGKWGWEVSDVIPFEMQILAPPNKGIIYTKDIFEKLGLDDQWISSLM